MMHNSMSKIEDSGSPIHRVASAAASDSNNQNISFTTKVCIHFSNMFDIQIIAMEQIRWTLSNPREKSLAAYS